MTTSRHAMIVAASITFLVAAATLPLPVADAAPLPGTCTTSTGGTCYFDCPPGLVSVYAEATNTGAVSGGATCGSTGVASCHGQNECNGSGLYTGVDSLGVCSAGADSRATCAYGAAVVQILEIGKG